VFEAEREADGLKPILGDLGPGSVEDFYGGVELAAFFVGWGGILGLRFLTFRLIAGNLFVVEFQLRTTENV
jgi:hypothetical protein